MSDSFSAMVAPDQIQVLPGHNARTEVGDVSELAASIAAVGLIQPLTVVELEAASGKPTYGLVAGERRLTAVRQLGLDQVPCTVLRGLDERQRTVVMLVENLQRQDLDPIEEAAGIQRLAGLGLSQREIASQLGCSQSHVSKRLALLGLPDQIRSAIGRPADAGGITVADALELTRLAEAPQRQAEAFRERDRHYGGIAGSVKNELAGLERERAVAEARSQLTSAGVTILKEETYYSWHGRPEKPLKGCGHDYESIGLTVEQHQGEPCHAAAIERDGKIVYVCREPTRHGVVDRAAARLKEEQRKVREESRQAREAAAKRQEAIATVLAAANTSQLPFAASQVIAGWRVDECRLACSFLGLAPKPGRYSPSYTEALAEHAGRNMGTAIKAVLALALAGGEQIVGGSWGGVSERSRRHLELLVAAGYQPNQADRKHLAGKEPDADEAEVPTCRVCGCTDDEACEAGCEWIEDPAGLGDLCSRCLPEAQAELAEESA